MLAQIDKQKRNAVEYQQNLSMLLSAGIGIVLTRSREPYRCIETVREFALESSRPFKYWDRANGWRSFTVGDDARNHEEAVFLAQGDDTTRDIKAAMEKLDAHAQDGTPVYPSNGIYMMMYPHWELAEGKAAVLVQILKEYAAKFSTDIRRLVLLCPPEFNLSSELQDDIPILDFDLPSFCELVESYDTLLDLSVPEEARPDFNREQVESLVQSCLGMTQLEFDTAFCIATTQSLKQKGKTKNAKGQPTGAGFTLNEYKECMAKVKMEAVKRSDVLEVMTAGRMSDIGGLDNLKEWISKREVCFSQEAKEFGVDVPKGIALIGPPGTGKSLAAKAIANVLTIPLIRFDVSRVFNKFVGNSEGRIRDALKRVDSMAPCVLLIDEVDKAFDSNSGGGDSGVGQRILGILLTWMQETTSPVFMVVTANNTEGLPPEFLRKGRLDEVFSVTVPNADERREILRIHLEKRNKPMPEDVGDFINQSEGYVPAEIEAAVKEALIEAYHNNKGEVTGALIAEQLSNMKPLSVAFAEKFERMRAWAENNARPASNAPNTVRIARPRPRVNPADVLTKGKRRMLGSTPNKLDA